MRALRPEDSLFVPLWCRARCAIEYPGLGVGAEDAALLRRVRADFSAARRSDCALYALRELLLARSARAALAEAPGLAVADLGCGLDTLPRRLGGEGTLRYYVDLPEAVSLRASLLPPAAGESYIAADLRSGLPEGIAAPEGVIFLMGGLLCHLGTEAALTLLADIARRFPGACLAFDGLGANYRGLARLPGEGELRSAALASLVRVRALPPELAALPPAERVKLAALLRTALRFYVGRCGA